VCPAAEARLLLVLVLALPLLPVSLQSHQLRHTDRWQQLLAALASPWPCQAVRRGSLRARESAAGETFSRFMS
jgi:hypothetical protein